MKRAIYVGESYGIFCYGMTGEAEPWGACDLTFVKFCPDGFDSSWMLYRIEIYITSEDQQRHCPKPV